MTKNEYDEAEFFAAYKNMGRSRGLEYAGEWHQLQPMFPDVNGMKILDLGCGMGWHRAYFSRHGAEEILGIDCSENMLETAKRKNSAENITYRLCDIAECKYPEDTYDFVFSNLALHYIENLTDIYGKVYKTLKSGGIFIFNIEHPTFTAGVKQEWVNGADGKPLYWPVDNYYYPGERQTDFLGCTVKKYHHTLTQILNGLIEAGFTITAVEEAMPPKNMMDIPGMRDEMRRPMMLLVKAEKK